MVSRHGGDVGFGRRVALVLLLALSPCVAAASPLLVHALVVSDPADGADGASAERRVEMLLTGSGRYRLQQDGVAEGRLGASPGGLYARCGLGTRCWRELGVQAGVDQVVLVELLDTSTLGLRVVDVAGTGGARTATLGPAMDGRVAFEALFFGPGALLLTGVPEDARVVLDGVREVGGAATIELAPIAAGKHAVEVGAEGFAPLFVAVMVTPDQQTAIAVTPLPLAPARRPLRWAPWAAVALVGTGGLAVAFASGGGLASAP